MYRNEVKSALIRSAAKTVFSRKLQKEGRVCGAAEDLTCPTLTDCLCDEYFDDFEGLLDEGLFKNKGKCVSAVQGACNICRSLDLEIPACLGALGLVLPLAEEIDL